MTKVEREISVLRRLHHPNIVELYDVIETEKYIGIILQCATGGELFDYILAHRYLKEKDASRLFAQLMSGVHYMHQKRIVHRDLKLENLLLDRNRNVLITDFGFANQFSSPMDDLMSTSCGSPCYAAPELVMNQGVYVGPAVDIWSCGVILFAMLCGYLPYDDDPANPDSYNINLLYKYILSTPLIFPDYISKEACDLLSLMLVPDPEKRCTMETIMAHPWLSAHRHLFVNINEDEEQEQMKNVLTKRGSSSLAIVPEKEDTTEQDQVIPASTSTLDMTQPENEQAQEQQPSSQQQEPSPQQDVVMEDVSSTVASSTTTTTEPKKEELPTPEKENKPTSSKEPIQRAAKNKVRPKSTVSSSTEKVLHFLSGHSTTPKPRNTNEKRTRHMSLATASAATEESHSSILQAKFLSSIQRRNTNNTSPTPNSSASTPHKRHNRASNIPTATTPSTARPSSTGTRRKTLSLLVNSVTDNIAHRRQPTTTTTTTTTSHRPADNQAHMVPSVSEHTMSDKEKHRSAGKKFMDWFKKKPLSTVNRSSGQPNAYVSNDPKLRTHHGAVDQEALTSRSPAQVFVEVKQTLKAMGLEFKRDGGEYKLKCVRPKKMPPIHHPQPHNPHLRNILRRSSTASQHPPSEPKEKKSVIYGEPSVDPGDEVRFSIELCRIKNLPGLYIVDMRRMRGNVWAYKYLYHTLMDSLKLKQKNGYLNQHSVAESTVEEEEEEEGRLHDTTSDNNNNNNDNNNNNRMSTASSGGSIGALLDNHKETMVAV
ncbi:Putative Fatty acyl-CoA synthetase and RNA processing-associated kinase 1 [Rhizopus microsporus]|nr:Putative Fatty acyl-CoA synthetase and RNA processing-associated kinase 1 [Rhizopus microsporus]